MYKRGKPFFLTLFVAILPKTKSHTVKSSLFKRKDTLPERYKPTKKNKNKKIKLSHASDMLPDEKVNFSSKVTEVCVEGSKDQRQQPTQPPEDRSGMKIQQACLRDPDSLSLLLEDASPNKYFITLIWQEDTLAFQGPTKASGGTVPSLENHRIFNKKNNSLPPEKKN